MVFYVAITKCLRLVRGYLQKFGTKMIIVFKFSLFSFKLILCFIFGGLDLLSVIYIPMLVKKAT